MDSKYFKARIHDEDLTGYECEGHPMILFSTVNPAIPVALAALMFRGQDPFQHDTIIWKRPPTSSTAHFQGLVNETGFEFELVITNLSGLGAVNFNILKTDNRVGEINPQSGLNLINELHPYESYPVKCDQATGRALVLTIMSDNKTVHTTETDSGGVASKTKGTYYWLSVAPSNASQQLQDLYAKTEWRAVNYFIQQKTRRSIQLEQLEHHNVAASVINRTPPSSRVVRPGGVIRRGFRGIAKSSPLSSLEFHVNSAISYEPEDEEEEEEGAEDFALFDDTTIDDTSAKGSKKGKVSALTPPEKKLSIIDASMAATVTGGRNIYVQGKETGWSYNYDRISEPCILGLSIALNLKFEPQNPDAVSENLRNLIDAYKANTVLELLQEIPTTYKEDMCIICQDESTGEPDVVFYKCGHQCIHRKCESIRMTSCPMCRQVITARINMK